MRLSGQLHDDEQENKGVSRSRHFLGRLDAQGDGYLLDIPLKHPIPMTAKHNVHNEKRRKRQALHPWRHSIPPERLGALLAKRRRDRDVPLDPLAWQARPARGLERRAKLLDVLIAVVERDPATAAPALGACCWPPRVPSC